MPIQGDHQTLSIPDLLDLVIHRKLTGTLVIATPTRDRSFCFVQGNIAYAVLNEPGQLLGEVLVRELELDSATVLEIQRELGPGEYLGQALIQRGVLEAEDLDLVIGRQIRRALRESLRFKTWAFHFQEEETTIRPGFCFPTQSVLLDLIREQDEWARIDEVFFDLDGIPVRMADSLRSRPIPNWPSELPAAGKILQEIGGRRSVRTLLEESPYPIYALACGLAELAEEGLIEIMAPSTDSDERAPLALPVLPNLSSRIFDILRHAADDEAVEELLLCDPILVSKTMHLVGARSHWDSETWTLADGLTRLGPITIRSMLLAEATRRLFLSPSRFSWYSSWTTSYLTSLTARDLAEQIGTVDPGHAQIAGLLHNIGSLVFAAVSVDGYADVQQRIAEGQDPREAEMEFFGAESSRVGAMLAESWGFPAELKTVIREYGGSLEHPKNQLLAVVRLAIELVRQPDERSKLCRRLLKKLRIPNGTVEDIRQANQGREERLGRVGVLA